MSNMLPAPKCHALVESFEKIKPILNLSPAKPRQKIKIILSFLFMEVYIILQIHFAKKTCNVCLISNRDTFAEPSCSGKHISIYVYIQTMHLWRICVARKNKTYKSFHAKCSMFHRNNRNFLCSWHYSDVQFGQTDRNGR